MYRYFANFKIYIFLLLSPLCVLCCRQIDTFYGPIEVEELVLLELIDSPAFQRLKEIHQYGVAYYTTHTEEYNRYDHSIGVFTILRANGAPLKEQIAGLLHDVSHTAFSHVGDWVFGKENQEEDYQNSIHALFLEKSGLAAILQKHHFSIEEILPREELFPALETPLPDLCADRIDYNIQGAYYQGFITYAEAIAIFEDVHFIDYRWVSSSLDLMRKLTRFSLFMTQDCWGSPVNYMTSRWLANAILRGIDLGGISYKDLHFGTDQVLWNMLTLHQDSIIQKNMKMLMDPHAYFLIVDASSEADIVVKSKFRGINPWITQGSKCLRITEIDKELAKEYENTKEFFNRNVYISSKTNSSF